MRRLEKLGVLSVVVDAIEARGFQFEQLTFHEAFDGSFAIAFCERTSSTARSFQLVRDGRDCEMTLEQSHADRSVIARASWNEMKDDASWKGGIEAASSELLARLR